MLGTLLLLLEGHFLKSVMFQVSWAAKKHLKTGIELVLRVDQWFEMLQRGNPYDRGFSISSDRVDKEFWKVILLSNLRKTMEKYRNLQKVRLHHKYAN